MRKLFIDYNNSDDIWQFVYFSFCHFLFLCAAHSIICSDLDLSDTELDTSIVNKIALSANDDFQDTISTLARGHYKIIMVDETCVTEPFVFWVTITGAVHVIK